MTADNADRTDWHFVAPFQTPLWQSQTTYRQGDHSALDTSWTTDEIRFAAISYLVAVRAVPVHIACGWASNFDSEVGGPFYWAPDTFGDGGKALGLAQWHSDRQPALFAFAEALGRNVYTRSLQIDFALQEVGTYPGGEALPGYMQRRKARGHILAALTAYDAARAISIWFEGPRDKEKEAVRRGWKATEFYYRWSMLPKPGAVAQVITLKEPSKPVEPKRPGKDKKP